MGRFIHLCLLVKFCMEASYRSTTSQYSTNFLFFYMYPIFLAALQILSWTLLLHACTCNFVLSCSSPFYSIPLCQEWLPPRRGFGVLTCATFGVNVLDSSSKKVALVQSACWCDPVHLSQVYSCLKFSWIWCLWGVAGERCWSSI